MSYYQCVSFGFNEQRSRRRPLDLALKKGIPDVS